MKPPLLLQLQQHLWKETLEFVSATLSSPTAAKLAAAGAVSGQLGLQPAGLAHAAASVEALAEVEQPAGGRQKLSLLQEFLAWQQKDALMKPLALPQLPLQARLLSSLNVPFT